MHQKLIPHTWLWNWPLTSIEKRKTKASCQCSFKTHNCTCLFMLKNSINESSGALQILRNMQVLYKSFYVSYFWILHHGCTQQCFTWIVNTEGCVITLLAEWLSCSNLNFAKRWHSMVNISIYYILVRYLPVSLKQTSLQHYGDAKKCRIFENQASSATITAKQTTKYASTYP